MSNADEQNDGFTVWISLLLRSEENSSKREYRDLHHPTAPCLPEFVIEAKRNKGIQGDGTASRLTNV